MSKPKTLNIGSKLKAFPGGSFNRLIEQDRVSTLTEQLSPPLPFPLDKTYLRTISARVTNTTEKLKIGLGVVPVFTGLENLGDVTKRETFMPAMQPTIDFAEVNIPDGTETVGQAIPFWICLSVATDREGSFVVSGPAWSWVDVKETWHDRVSLQSWSGIAADSGLETDLTGYKIIWKPAATGFNWVLVDVGSFQNNYEYLVQLPSTPKKYGVYPVSDGNMPTVDDTKIPTVRHISLTLTKTAAEYDKVRRFVFVGNVPTTGNMSWANAALDGLVVCGKHNSGGEPWDGTVGASVGPTSEAADAGLSSAGSGFMYVGDVPGSSTLAYFIAIDLIEKDIGTAPTGPTEPWGMIRGTGTATGATFTIDTIETVYGATITGPITVENTPKLQTAADETIYAMRDASVTSGWSTAVAANIEWALRGLNNFNSLRTAKDPEVFYYDVSVPSAHIANWASMQVTMKKITGWAGAKAQLLMEDGSNAEWGEGFKGEDGDAGPKGPDGTEQGDQGPQGDVGEQGPRGTRGQPGQPGPEGSVGSKGPEGGVGPVGDRGDRGGFGRNGDPGENKFDLTGAKVDNLSYVKDITAMVWEIGSGSIGLKVSFTSNTGSFVDWDDITIIKQTPQDSGSGQECPLP